MIGGGVRMKREVIVCEECGTVCESCAGNRAEVRRLRAWLRWWNTTTTLDYTTADHLRFMILRDEIEGALSGKPAPRARRAKP